ncbi:hypothetical protein [Acidovorax sp. CCYZU-2555]|uniref:hypothetical protein n=1 Tax=Acidovorax sp. CCYZU-2555 TaxID=2835042 RepID=UPI001BCAC823|nr:hypothetical protein [Acidovorax sp. CCYZU-2555]MBS7776803.1 hypothetical protein [Acidovorax sp. CCYZU-2555]
MFEFTKAKSLGALPTQAVGDYLLSIDDINGSRQFMDGDVSAQGIFGYNQAYLPCGMLVGFIEPVTSPQKTLEIVSASEISADLRLQGSRIKLTLDRFYVESYPGTGEHTILCEFNGKNQVLPENEELKFATKFSANDKSAAAVMNAPIFLGLTVANDGISFEGRTINIESKGSEAILAALETPVFKAGLSLISTAQPALKQLVSLAAASIKNIESSKKNKQVHHFNLGLDFSDRVTSARLRLGTYIIIQTDSASWDWTQFEWQRDAMLLRDVRKTHAESIGFNYLAIGVSNFES